MSSTMSQLPVRQHSAGSLLRPYFQHWMPSTKSCVPPRSLVPQVNAYWEETPLGSIREPSEPLGLSRVGRSVPVSSMPLKGTGEARCAAKRTDGMGGNPDRLY